MNKLKLKPIRSYILAGLVVWLPILVTFYVIRFIVDLLDALLPSKFQPDFLFGYHIPGFGVVLSLSLVIFTGIIATNILGQRLLHMGDVILTKIPLVRTIYYGSQQIIRAVFASNSQAFRKVMLIQYPSQGIWTLAFLTGNVNSEISAFTGDEDMLSVFIPTTPNPTSGFLMMVAKKNAVELTMTVEEAMKYIISLGVVSHETDAVTAAPILKKHNL